MNNKHGRFAFSFLSACLLLLTATALYADTPNLLTYQGRLTDAGVPVTGARTVALSLCTAASGGTCHSAGTGAANFSNGLFKSTFTVPGAVNLSNGDWYLDVQVGTVTFTPRERLTSVAYSVFAASASTAGGLYSRDGWPITVSSPVWVTGGLTVNSGPVSATSFQFNGANALSLSGTGGLLVGEQAGENNSASYNTFVGVQAGNKTNTGAMNTMAGYRAGYYNEAGSHNAIFGYLAGHGSGANNISSNTIVGYRAGYSLNNTYGNVLMGYQAGYTLTSGANNIILGYGQNAPSPTTSNHLNIGGAIYGDLATGNIGIGAADAPVKLAVAGGVLATSSITAQAGVYTNSLAFTGAPGADSYMAVPFTASGSITAKQVVVLVADNTVAVSVSSGSASVIGVAVNSAGNGDIVMVAVSGVVSNVITDQVVTLGQTLETGVTPGTVRPVSFGPYVGKALSGAASGSPVSVLLTQYW